MTTKTDHLKLLRKYSLKPTSQRLFLSEIIFSGEDMHLTNLIIELNIY